MLGIFVSWFSAWNQKENILKRRWFGISSSGSIAQGWSAQLWHYLGTTSPEAEKPAWQVVITNWKDLVGPKRYFYIIIQMTTSGWFPNSKWIGHTSNIQVIDFNSAKRIWQSRNATYLGSSKSTLSRPTNTVVLFLWWDYRKKFER